jgi:hypothetical protein
MLCPDDDCVSKVTTALKVRVVVAFWMPVSHSVGQRELAELLYDS